MTSENEENKVLQQVKQLSEREQEPPPFWLTLNRLKILLEKCYLTYRGFFLVIEFFIPIFFAWYLRSSILQSLSQLNKLNQTIPTPSGPLYPPITMNPRLILETSHYYMVKDGANLALVEEFIEEIKKASGNDLTFTKVDSTVALDWKEMSIFGFYNTRLLLLFDEKFTRKSLVYHIVRPDLLKENLDEKWSLVNEEKPYAEDTLGKPEVRMHFIVSQAFQFWTKSQPPTLSSLSLHPFELDTFYNVKSSGMNLRINCTPEMVEFYSYIFLMLIMATMLTYHTTVSKEAEEKSKEFLKLMGATNTHIFGINAIYFTLQTSIMMILPMLYFYYASTFDNMPIWPAFLQLFQLFAATGVHVQLIAIIFPNLTLSRLLLMIHLAMTFFSFALKDKWWYWLLFYPGPFFSFHVNWQLSFDALYKGGSVSKLFQSNPDYGNLSWFASYTLSWLFIGLSFLFLLYLAEVWPFQHGNIRPFYYIFNKDYWFPNNQANAKISPMPAQNLKRFEPPLTTPIISIRSLLKGYRSGGPQFKWRPVIKDLNFDFHDNQITALLGFNGAGKTTLIDMITGMNTIEGGQIQVAGKNVQNETAAVRTRLGLCPQMNLFYSKLTVGQNLRLAAVMKGISFETADRKAELAASLVNLKDQINKKAGDLSGGMKRRLCIACAIIGNWDVCILDEPTSGLDPETRRDVWDLLLQIRKVRTIILTTHFMEEADVLADRIAIMAKGEIVCAGSASFLKRAYQTGYVLNLHLKADCDRKSLLRQIQYHVPNAVVYGEKTSELTIQLLESTEQDNQMLNAAITLLFRWLESYEGQEYVQSFNLNNTSLEDVFLKVGEEGEVNEKANTKNGVNGVHNQAFDDISLAEQVGDPDSILLFNRPVGFQRIWVQFNAIIYKRLCYLLKQFITTLRMIFLPLLFIFLLIIAVNFFYDKYIAIGKAKSVSADFKDLYPQTKTLFSCDGQVGNQEKLQKYVAKATALGLNPIVLQDANTNLTSYIQKRADDTQNPKEYAFGLTIGGSVFSDLVLWPNYIYKYSLPASISFIFAGQADQNGSDDQNQNDHEISLSFKLEPYKSDLQGYLLFTSISMGAMLMLLLVVLVFISMNALTSPQEELKRLAFFMQKVAGISKNVYWATNHFFDYCYFAGIVSLMLLLLALTDKSGLFALTGHSYDILTLYLSGISLIVVAYLFVRLLYHSKFMSTLFNLYVFVGMLAPVFTVVIAEALKKPISQTKQGIMFAIFPQSAFVYAILRIIFQNGIRICLDSQTVGCDKIATFLPSSSNDDETFYMYIMLLTAILTSIVNSCDYITDPICNGVIQLFDFILKKKQYNDGYGLRHHLKVDEEIIKEEDEVQRIVQTQDFKGQVLVASKLRKKFGSKLAVNDISFKIADEECFGLLGLNGAGKSTTFSMLTGEKSITSGQVYLKGQELKPSNMKNFYEFLSYCPQTECHFKDLTVLQIILFYLRAQGSPSSFTFRIAKRIIELTDLQEYSNSTADNLSGGNKRKLSLAMALISVPNLILLDEPTTGVDPVARRKIWKCLNLHRRIGRCTYLLTSHSMDECEFLCDRIAIMANGKLRCLGTASELKQNYAQGFKITLKVEYHRVHDKEYVETVKSRLSSCFPEKISFQEMHMNTMDFVLNDSNVLWSELFARLQELSKELNLIDFVVKATSLEEVFLSFAD